MPEQEEIHYDCCVFPWTRRFIPSYTSWSLV